VWFPCISPSVSALHGTENSSNLQTDSRCSLLDTSKSLKGTQNTKAVMVSPQVNIHRIKVRGPCRASASYPPFSESLIQRLSDNMPKIRKCPIMHEPHALSPMKSRILQASW
jgi:hypothetical protein